MSRPQSDEEEEDGDYSPDEDDFKKTIMVGSEFQAVIPEELCKYGDVLPYENEDKLVWDPTKLQEQEVIKYEQKSSQISLQQQSGALSIAASTSTSSASSATTGGNGGGGVMSIPIGNHLRDDEQNLYLLLQCGHNVDEALRRRRINVAAQPSSNTMSQWSEEECRNFESGLRVYGKDFHTIQQFKVKTRSVGELVQFYYLWKKTERHDVFANKARLEKKKYSLHPGLTDYMDRFLEEQEYNGSNIAGGGSGAATSSNYNIGGTSRERSSSPSVNCLIYANYRRPRGSGDHSHQSITDPLATNENDLYHHITTSTTNLKPKETHSSHYSLNTSKL